MRGATGCRYLDDIERQRKYVQQGWNLTGDAYRMDENGYFWYQARTDDMIVTAGYNVSGPEVEGVLLDHPKIRECAVVGAPDAERGTIVKAFVVLRDPRHADAATARNCRTTSRRPSRLTSTRAAWNSSPNCRAPKRARCSGSSYAKRPKPDLAGPIRACDNPTINAKNKGATEMLRRTLLAALAIAVPAFAIQPAAAQQGVKIGLITTQSGPNAGLGRDMVDGFNLAIKHAGGRLGGVPTELIVGDDQFRPDAGKAMAERMVQRDRVDIVTGVIFSNIMLALSDTVLKERRGVFLISGNAGPSELAGKDCHPNFFSASWQNDNTHEAMGQHMTNAGIKRAYIMAPNYPAGRDALAGFKRFFKGEIAGESTPSSARPTMPPNSRPCAPHAPTPPTSSIRVAWVWRTSASTRSSA